MRGWPTSFVALIITWGVPANAATNCDYPNGKDYINGTGRSSFYDGVGHMAALRAFWACTNKEDKEQSRKDEDARQEASSAAGAVRKAANDFVERASERATQGAVEAHGDAALGVGGPRDANIDRVANAAIKAADSVPQSNGISARLTGIATRSAVDVNSRAMGSFQAGMKDFGGVNAPPATASSLPPPSFAPVSTPSSELDIGAFSGALDAAARDVGARGVSDMRVSDQQLQWSGVGDRVGDSVRRYNASIDRSNDTINARSTADARSLDRFHEIRDNARANAAAHSSSSSAFVSSNPTSSPTYSSTAQSSYSSSSTSDTKSTYTASGCPNNNERYANGTCSRELGSNPGNGPH